MIGDHFGKTKTGAYLPAVLVLALVEIGHAATGVLFVEIEVAHAGHPIRPPGGTVGIGLTEPVIHIEFADIETLASVVHNGRNGARFPMGDVARFADEVAGDPLIFDLQVARPQSVAGGAETFFVNSSTSSYNQIALWKLTGDRTNAPALVRTSIPTGTYYPVYENVRQPDTTARIDGFSNQMLEAAYSQRHVWASLGSGENSATPTCRRTHSR